MFVRRLSLVSGLERVCKRSIQMEPTRGKLDLTRRADIVSDMTRAPFPKLVPRFDSVVFSGGGVRGIAYAGALKELAVRKGIDWGAKCPALKQVGGCSIGSLVALCVAIGYTVPELYDMLTSTRLDHLVSLDPLHLISVMTAGRLGFDSGETLKDFVKGLLAKKGVQENITFESLATLRGIDLHVVATCLDTNCLETFSPGKTPSVRVVDAIRASMALPPLYEPVEVGGKLYSDGGVLDNFPLHLFHQDRVIGFRLAAAPKTIDQIKAAKLPLLPYLNYMLRLSSAVSDSQAWRSIPLEVRQSRVVNIDCGKVSSFETNPEKAVTPLLEAGKAAISKWLTEEVSGSASEAEEQIWKQLCR